MDVALRSVPCALRASRLTLDTRTRSPDTAPMRKAFLALLLLAVPLLVVPWAVTFDASKAALLAAGMLILAAKAMPKRTEEGPGRLDLRWSAPSAAAAIALLVLGASAVRGPDAWAAARLLALLLAAGTFLLAVENAVFEAGELLPLVRAAAWAQGIAAGYGLLQAAGIDFPFPWREEGRILPVSTLGNPNFAAEFVAASLPLTVLVAIRSRGAGRAGAILGVLLGIGLLAAARGRAAFLLGVPCAAAAAGALLLYARGGGRRIAGFALGGAALVALLAGEHGKLSSAMELPSWLGRSDTFVVRRDLARGTARMLLDHPLGVGAGNWEAAGPPYRTEAEYRASLFRDPGEAHDDLLQFAAEGGWPFAFAAAALAVLLVGAAARAARTGADPGLAAAFLAVLAATAGISIASAPFHRPAHLLLAAFAAGGLCVLGGGRTTTLGFAGRWVHRLLVLLLAGAALLLGIRMVAEGPQADGRRIERESNPLPRERAVEARDLFARATEIDPGAADAWARAGEVSVKLGVSAADPAAAKEEFRRAEVFLAGEIRLRPSDPMARSNLALAVAPWHRNANQAFAYFLSRRKRASEALPFVEKALQVDSAYAPAVGTRAEILVVLGKEAEALAAASDGIDHLLAAGDRVGAREAARRASAASPALAAMLVGKAARLLAGPDLEGGREVLYGALAARPEEDLLEKGAQALSAAKLHDESVRLRVDARFAAAEAALLAGDRDRAAAEARRAQEITASTEEMRRNRVLAASLFARAGKREEALGSLGLAVSRGFADPGRLESDPAFTPLREDPAFRSLVEKARKNARKDAPKSAEK